jgi:hypothetical protein
MKYSAKFMLQFAEVRSLRLAGLSEIARAV